MTALAAQLSHVHERRRYLSFQEQIDRLLDLSALDNGEINDLNPLALAASANPNILTHSEAKRAADYPKFLEAMKEEVTNMTNNKIFDLVPRSVVPRQQRILRGVWSHRRNSVRSLCSRCHELV